MSQNKKLKSSTSIPTSEKLRQMGMVRAPTAQMSRQDWDEIIVTQPLPLTSTELLAQDRG